MDDSDNKERVPYDPPYGGITDEDHICVRCGEHQMGCHLCVGMEIKIARIRGRK